MAIPHSAECLLLPDQPDSFSHVEHGILNWHIIMMMIVGDHHDTEEVISVLDLLYMSWAKILLV